MTPCCKDCPNLESANSDEELIELMAIFNVDFYYGKGVEGYQMMVSNHLFDVLRREMRPTSWEIVLFMTRHTKHNHNDPVQRRFTYKEAMEGAGIKARSTMWECIAELENGLKPTENREAMSGQNLINHITGYQRDGNLYGLNLDLTIPNQGAPVFGIQRGNFTQMHHLIIDSLMKQLSHEEFYIFSFIWRHTIGFQRQETQLAMTYLKEMSGISKHSTLRKITQKLADWKGVGLITITKSKNGDIYAINKNIYFDEQGGIYCNMGDYFLEVNMRARVTPHARQGHTPCAPGSHPMRARVTQETMI